MPPDAASPSQPGTAKANAPPPSTEDHRDALLQIQGTDPFFKHISKWLFNGKAPYHEAGSFIHIKGLFYKHAMDITQKFLALVIPKSWCFTVLIEAHNTLGQQGISPHQMIVLLEGNGQGHLQIHCKLHPVQEEKGKNENIPIRDDKYTGSNLWQNCHRFSHTPKCLHVRKPAHPHHHWPFDRIARSFSHSQQKSRHYCLCIHQNLFSCPHVPQIYIVQ